MVGPAKLVGARVKRTEDPRLLTGRGAYVSTMKMPGMVDMAVLRSPHARALIKSIDVEEARSIPGVVAVFTGEDIKGRVKPLRAELDPREGRTYSECDWHPLAQGEVRHVGDPVAAVVAESRYLAEDAADLIQVDYEVLDPVTDPEKALNSDSELVHPEWGDNVMSRAEVKFGDPDGAFSDAACVVRQRFRTNRHHGLSLEARGVLATYDAYTDEIICWTSSQMPHLVRSKLAEHLDHSENKLRVIAPDVGGGFGMKAHFFLEEALTVFVARDLKMPVRWLEDRRESFVASPHAKDMIVEAELAADSEGAIRGIRFKGISDVGAYSAYPWTSVFEVLHAAQMFPGPYRIENYDLKAVSVATNKSTLSVFRGVGAPASTFVMEGLLDLAARKLKLDPAEIRLRNLIRQEEFPYTSCTGMEYESGSYVESLQKAMKMVGYDEFREEQRKLRKQGVYRGIGISCYNEVTAAGSHFWNALGVHVSAYESANIKMDPQGQVTLFLGTHSHGQAHETVFAQIAADELGVPFERIKVRLGDTADTPYGWGAWASRAAVIGGGAVIGASQKLASKLRRIAGHYLEVSAEDIELVNGEARVIGVPGRGVDIAEIAERVIYKAAADLPEGEDPGLDETHYYEPPPVTFPNAAHIAVVDVDTETGAVDVVRYVVVEDCGKMINPMVVDGQVAGGVAQGFGGAMLEHLVYDENGQLMTTSFMDYLIPSAPDVPQVEIGHLETPSPLVPGGFKGAGEGGAIAPWGAMANAVSDALAHTDCRASELPLTPERIYDLARS